MTNSIATIPTHDISQHADKIHTHMRIPNIIGHASHTPAINVKIIRANNDFALSRLVIDKWYSYPVNAS